jgi:mRNA interferase MazF
MHDYLRTVIVAPMTTGSRQAPFRIPITLGGKRGLILVDQIRTVDKIRLAKRVGKATPRTVTAALTALREVFAE